MKARLIACLFSIIYALTGFALDLDSALALAFNTGEVRQAQAQVQLLQSQLAASQHPGDLSLSLSPSYRRTSDELFGASRSDSLSLSAGFSLPLGLSESAASRADQLAAQLDNALALEALALDQARLRIYGLFTSAWAAQQELTLAGREVLLAEAELVQAQALFRSGGLAYSELRKAEEKQLLAHDRRSAAEMASRISRLQLFSALGRADNGQTLSLRLPEAGTLPKAPELAANAILHDPAIRDALARRDLALEEISRAAGLSPAVTIRVNAAKDGHSLNLSFVADGARLAGEYQLPVNLGSTAAQPTPWTIGASLSVSLPIGPAGSLASSTLAATAALDKLKLQALMDKLSLDVRVAYQAWIRAEAAREQAGRAAALSAELAEVVKNRAALGSISEGDLRRAELDAERDALNADIKKLEAERFRLAAALAARYPTKPQGVEQ